jgi:hypothetical protein
MAKTPKPRVRKTAGGRTPTASGPVTLAEARALALARQPERMMSKAARPPAPAATAPAEVAAARRDAAARRKAEIEQRIRDYTATMRIMKARGARAARAPKGPPGARFVAKDTGFRPLQVLAEGDSWFDYPAHLRGGLIPRLANRLGVPILNLAKAGDEVRFMMGVEQRRDLGRHLTEGCPAGGPWDLLLFSGGGNDVVDNPLALWLRDFVPGAAPQDLVHARRFEAVLALVRAGYEDLIEMRDRLSPDTHLVFHAYDFAIPDGRGVCAGLLGPWLRPAFDLRGFPRDPPDAAAAVVRVMLQGFARMLAQVARRRNVTFLDAQGTLPPETASWHNELHPTSAGFDAFAVLFHERLRELFPGRVV